MFFWVFGMMGFLVSLKIEFDNEAKKWKGDGAMNTLPQGGRARKEFWKKEGGGIEASRTVLRYVPSTPIAFSEESNRRYAEKGNFLASIHAEIAPQLKQIQGEDFGWEREKCGRLVSAESQPSFVSGVELKVAFRRVDLDAEGGGREWRF